MNYSSKKNLLQTRDTYNRYYGDFRGVDFSSDHSQVIDQRLAYSVNMYKDYQSGQGQAIETIPGFRRRISKALGGEIDGVLGEKINGLHFTKLRDGVGQMHDVVLIHAGESLYHWLDFGSDETEYASSTTITTTIIKKNGRFAVKIWDRSPNSVVTRVELPIPPSSASSSWTKTEIRFEIDENDETILYLFYHPALKVDSTIQITLYEKGYHKLDIGIHDEKSVSFVFNNALYILDGYQCFKYFDGFVSPIGAYIPTTYKNIMPSGENANAGIEYEQRNLLTYYFKNTFFYDEKNDTRTFKLSETDLDGIVSVYLYGKRCTEFTRDLPAGKITISDNFEIPKGIDYMSYAGVEITALKRYENQNEELITKCTLATTFDDRIFVSGNPLTPNTVYWCGRNATTGLVEPTYFPINNYVQAGVGYAPITGLIPVADTLMALKSDTQQDGAVYYIKGIETGDDLVPKIYQSERGLSGIGCMGACVNFLDDPVFLSRLGLEGISKLEIASERSIQHRSSLVDAKLSNFTEKQLKDAVIEEWNGYLMLLVDGKIFMADSRQMYTDETGVMQYEWYYLEGIGVYEEQYDEYVYDNYIPSGYENVSIDNKYPLSIHENVNGVANPEKNDVVAFTENGAVVFYYKIENGKAYVCRPTGAKIGGTLKKATTLKSFDGNLFFGTENGYVCSFNFDLRENGEIPIEHYNFDGRTIICGAATKMDNCGIPHLAKSTVKKSTVIKTRSFAASAIKVKVRTNKTSYKQIARINTNTLDFGRLDFSDFSFITEGDTIFAIKEKEKQWVEKQYYLFSDEYCKPFSLHYISYRYNISGRVKL